MRKTFGRKSREKVEHPSARMMPNQKKNCREVCVQAQKLLEEKRRKEEKGGRRRDEGDKRGWGIQGGLPPSPVPSWSVACLLRHRPLPPVLGGDGGGCHDREGKEPQARRRASLRGWKRRKAVDPEEYPPSKDKTGTPRSNHQGGEAASGCRTVGQPTGRLPRYQIEDYQIEEYQMEDYPTRDHAMRNRTVGFFPMGGDLGLPPCCRACPRNGSSSEGLSRNVPSVDRYHLHWTSRVMTKSQSLPCRDLHFHLGRMRSPPDQDLQWPSGASSYCCPLSRPVGPGD